MLCNEVKLGQTEVSLDRTSRAPFDLLGSVETVLHITIEAISIGLCLGLGTGYRNRSRAMEKHH